ncbi:preprotein translocase subunit SecY [Candidatus Roizmanbacteria bacterium RIFCSPHIGHO2_01_FULL_39_12b]|uniref:Protein translocase subunit SecY n=1 Tax=Candidatus Roizmanbacteria bacterium RIFCSPHIGHO2_01_FULL_39_12b TaxID=1802030 RepID=A0A1F7GC71_9BACT|nr:MAG: preprotein translocase subunit SecY [Candidatus Roizmanbacteria bacterium RIFCSPHIGHO2_01_FULL_39_12b]OGK47088.1 MAG: preprotein translocase subunit SecY [Candidatus Roizmanbacteria bacterium RIFCSPLOWO2_01_FULL_39_19]
MKEIISKLKLAFGDPKIRKKIIFTFAIITLFRIFAFLPVSVVDLSSLRQLFAKSQFFALLDIFSGGTLINFSVMALGLGPYINASIIMQLLTVVFPFLEALSKEGEYGRHKINQYTRTIALPITILQSIGVYLLLHNQKVVPGLTPLQFIAFVTTLTAGSYILMWFGELISEHGLGNGISVLIFVGIISRLPVVSMQTISTITQETILNVVMLIILAILVVYAVVFINEAIRKVPVYYAKRIRGNKVYQQATNYLPLKLNQAGVIPIIFAISFVLFPQMIGNFLVVSKNTALVSFGSFLTNLFTPTGIVYNVLYFLLVVGFTFFYTVIVFNPDKIADEIQKHGGFIPGIRPGTATKTYLQNVLYRITTVGALFLGLIAVMPSVLSAATGIKSIIIGGTGVLIVVSVVLETFKLIEAQVVMKSYDSLAR